MQLIPKIDVLHYEITKQLQKHLAYSPQGRVNKEVKYRGFVTP